MEGQFGSRAPNSPEPQKAADFPEAPFNQTVSPWLHRPEIAGMETGPKGQSPDKRDSLPGTWGRESVRLTDAGPSVLSFMKLSFLILWTSTAQGDSRQPRAAL